MKSVLISIQPKWCELIASGKKTVEVRKTKPKLETPFKVYIYCTKSKNEFLQSRNNMFFYCEYEDFIGGHGTGTYQRLNGKVIGEFVCDDITKILNRGSEFIAEDRSYCELQTMARGSCLDFVDMKKYFGNNDGYGWHISDLVIYDKPKELGEFVVEGDCLNGDCKKCKWFDSGNDYNVEADCLLPYDFHFKKAVKPLFRPPQSWCYVESESDAE